MNVKVVVSGIAALGILLGGVVYREQITALFKGKSQTASNGQAAKGTNASSSRARKGRRGNGGGAVAVTLATVEQRSAPQFLKAIGVAQAVATVAVKSRVDGQIDEVLFQEGDAVKKGQILFRLDRRPFEIALRRAEANLARDRAQLDRRHSDVNRYTDLVKQGYASQQKLEEVDADMRTLQASIRADEAAVDSAKLDLDYASIRAPLDGRTGNVLLTIGSLIRANDTNASSIPLVLITRMQPMNVAFSVPETHLPQIRALMAARPVPVEATISGDAANKQIGRLSFINNTVDAATGTIQLKASFANLDEALTPGAFVNTSLVIRERPNAIVIPTGALQIGQKGSFVWIARDDNTVEVRPITLDETNQVFSVISAGLKPGEKVVTDGQLNLVPGGRIRPREPGTGGNESAQAPDGAAAPAVANGDDGAAGGKTKQRPAGGGS